MKNPFKQFRKSGTQKEQDSRKVILVFAISALTGILLYVMTRKIILFALSMVLGVTLYFLFSDKTDDTDKNRKGIRQNHDFFESFYMFSIMNNSYWEGFRCAYDAMKLSHMKDKLTDYLENPDTPLDIHVTNSRTENRLIDMLIRFLHSEEETKDNDMEEFRNLLEAYKSEGNKEKKEMPVYILPLLIILTIVIIVVFTFLNRQ